jgi:hypothetical protein
VELPHILSCSFYSMLPPGQNYCRCFVFVCRCKLDMLSGAADLDENNRNHKYDDISKTGAISGYSFLDKGSSLSVSHSNRVS